MCVAPHEERGGTRCPSPAVAHRTKRSSDSDEPTWGWGAYFAPRNHGLSGWGWRFCVAVNGERSSRSAVSRAEQGCKQVRVGGRSWCVVWAITAILLTGVREARADDLVVASTLLSIFGLLLQHVVSLPPVCAACQPLNRCLLPSFSLALVAGNGLIRKAEMVPIHTAGVQRAKRAATSQASPFREAGRHTALLHCPTGRSRARPRAGEHTRMRSNRLLESSSSIESSFNKAQIPALDSQASKPCLPPPWST